MGNLLKFRPMSACSISPVHTEQAEVGLWGTGSGLRKDV